MCKWNKWGDTRIDPCIRKLINSLNNHGTKTLASCCGHGKYDMSIIVKYNDNEVFDLISDTNIPRKRRFYKRDKQGVYYIPEVD